MNTENKKDMIVLPADFQFEKPTLTEFSYNKVASVQGASGGGVDPQADTNLVRLQKIAAGQNPWL